MGDCTFWSYPSLKRSMLDQFRLSVCECGFNHPRQGPQRLLWSLKGLMRLTEPSSALGLTR